MVVALGSQAAQMRLQCAQKMVRAVPLRAMVSLPVRQWRGKLNLSSRLAMQADSRQQIHRA